MNPDRSRPAFDPAPPVGDPGAPHALDAFTEPAHARPRSLGALRWIIVAVAGGMFLAAAATLGPRASRATDLDPARSRPRAAQPAPGASDPSRTNPARRFLGELHGREYAVRIDITPDGTRYTVTKNGQVVGRDLSGDELTSSFPDLDVSGMEAQPEGGGALMLADPDEH